MIRMLAPATSIGIRWFSEQVVAALSSLGVHVELTSDAGARSPSRSHFQLGNSTRSI